MLARKLTPTVVDSRRSGGGSGVQHNVVKDEIYMSGGAPSVSSRDGVAAAARMTLRMSGNGSRILYYFEMGNESISNKIFIPLSTHRLAKYSLLRIFPGESSNE